jgi:hypothetical protein
MQDDWQIAKWWLMEKEPGLVHDLCGKQQTLQW